LKTERWGSQQVEEGKYRGENARDREKILIIIIIIIIYECW
jgi:hypothetical protein